MPVEVFDDHIRTLRADRVSDCGQGIVLASVRDTLSAHMEALRECIANGEIPTEQLFRNLSDAQRDMYKFAAEVEETLESLQDPYEQDAIQTGFRDYEDRARRERGVRNASRADIHRQLDQMEDDAEDADRLIEDLFYESDGGGAPGHRSGAASRPA